MRGDANPGRVYARTLLAIYAAATPAGLIAGTFLPHPIAVMTVVGALTACAAAPFIAPIPDRSEDT